MGPGGVFCPRTERSVRIAASRPPPVRHGPHARAAGTRRRRRGGGLSWARRWRSWRRRRMPSSGRSVNSAGSKPGVLSSHAERSGARSGPRPPRIRAKPRVQRTRRPTKTRRSTVSFRSSAAANGEAVVALTLPGRMTEFRRGHFGNRGRLTRELMRQAVLMTSRDGMNLTVRDASVGDPLPQGKPDLVIRVDTLCPEGGKPKLRLWRDAEGGTDGKAKRVVLLDPPSGTTPTCWPTASSPGASKSSRGRACRGAGEGRP